ncbi:NMDA receptor-regulated protein 1-domain-containing protein, partial [Gaertneriomyces semiglobifer]
KPSRELPSKESAMFKAILRFYEHKQYKKGLKQAEQILKKFPEHGETLAMKGLFLSYLDRKEEGYDFVKKGLRYDLTSHTCWHVYGLMYRADKNYEEAIKCYVNALKFDKENIQIIRDLSLLQIQMRNYEGFNETRHQLLSLRPTNRMYWAGLAISYHLLKKYDTALSVLSAFENSLKEQPDVADFEQSETFLYENMIIEESGELDKALDHLAEIRTKVIDHLSWKEAKARILLKAGKNAEAEVEYRQLLDLNPDSKQYLEGLVQARGLAGDLDNAKREMFFRLLGELGKKYPRSHIVQQIPLKHATGDQFRSMVDEYLKPRLRKGVPSLFVSLKDILSDQKKSQIVEQLVLDYETALKQNSRFPGASVDEDAEPPTAILWVLYFLAQHYDLKGDSKKAVRYIDEAVAHTPTIVELYMTKARILKHGGDLDGAAKVMNEGREIDLQDRYINSKCTKYMLRNDKTTEAEDTIALFARSEPTDPLNVIEMQCMWYTLECGKSFMRQGNFGKALKEFALIEKHFTDIYDDQFDFHSYSLRKMTLRAYIDLLRVEDRLRDHPFYVEAAINAVKIYIQLADKPKTQEGKEDLASLSEADRKKAERKARKAALKNATTAADKSQPPDQAGNKKKGDDDPDGTKLLNVDDYLAEAMKWLQPLLELSPRKIESHVLGVAVNVRRKKFLLALRSLKAAYEIYPNHPELFREAIRFHQAVADPTLKLDPRVKLLIDEEVQALFKGKDAK